MFGPMNRRKRVAACQRMSPPPLRRHQWPVWMTAAYCRRSCRQKRWRQAGWLMQSISVFATLLLRGPWSRQECAQRARESCSLSPFPGPRALAEHFAPGRGVFPRRIVCLQELRARRHRLRFRQFCQPDEPLPRKRGLNQYTARLSREPRAGHRSRGWRRGSPRYGQARPDAWTDPIRRCVGEEGEWLNRMSRAR